MLSPKKIKKYGRLLPYRKILQKTAGRSSADAKSLNENSSPSDEREESRVYQGGALKMPVLEKYRHGNLSIIEPPMTDALHVIEGSNGTIILKVNKEEAIKALKKGSESVKFKRAAHYSDE